MPTQYIAKYVQFTVKKAVLHSGKLDLHIVELELLEIDTMPHTDCCADTVQGWMYFSHGSLFNSVALLSLAVP